MTIGGIGKSAFRAFINVRETVTFYMFIVEESIQAVSMAVYLAYQTGDSELANDLIDYNITQLIDPLIAFASNPAADLAWPMSDAFLEFAKASRQSMETYRALI